MRQLLKREWRLLWRWWALAMLMILLAWFHTANKANHQIGAPLFISGDSQLISVLGFAGIGLLFGAAQAWPDALGARWTAYVQSPIARSRLFVSKCLVGVALLLSVTLGSVLLMALMITLRGRVVSPFEASMLLVPAMDSLTAIVYYLGALTVVFRPGRWVGSRLLPLGVPLATTLAVLSAPSQGWAVLVLLVALLLAVLGAWGSFCVGDSGWSLSPALYLARMVHMASGLWVGALVVVLFGAWALNLSLEEPRQNTGMQYYAVGQGGQVLKIERAADGWRQFDLAGNLVDEQLRSSNDQWSLRLTSTNTTSLPRYRDESRWIQRLSGADKRVRAQWYYLRASNQVVGYAMDEPAEVGRWSLREVMGANEELLSVNREGLFVTAKAVYRFNFPAHRFETVMRATDAPILAAGVSGAHRFRQRAMEVIVVWAGAALHVIRDGKPAGVFPLKGTSSEATEVSIYGFDDNVTCWTRRGPASDAGSVVTRYAKLDVANTNDLLPVDEVLQLPDLLETRTERARLRPAMALVLPPIVVPARGILSRWLGRVKDFDVGALFQALLAACTIMSALMTWRMAKRHGASNLMQCLWALAAVPMGLMAPMLFRSLHPAVVAVKCQLCQTPFPLAESDCRVCAKQSPARPAIVMASAEVDLVMDGS